MLVLASQSPVRAALLSKAGVVFTMAKSPYDEGTAQKQYGHLDTLPLSELLAAGKAIALSAQRPTYYIIGCDQTLECHGRTFHKNESLEDAAETLKSLRGQTHQLHSTVCVAHNNTVIFRHTSSVQMQMRNFTDDYLQHYLRQAGSAILGSVGCYHFEEMGTQLFDHVDGDYHAILGLPLLPLLAFLRQIGDLKT